MLVFFNNIMYQSVSFPPVKPHRCSTISIREIMTHRLNLFRVISMIEKRLRKELVPVIMHIIAVVNTCSHTSCSLFCPLDKNAACHVTEK